jgi:outer membrane protein assembly factor BamB
VVDAGAVHALTTDGDRFWKRPSADFGLPVLAGDTLYVGGYAGSGADSGDPAGLLAALDAADGTERWSYTTRGYWDDSGNPDIHAATTAPVAVADGAVFALTGAGDLLALG